MKTKEESLIVIIIHPHTLTGGNKTTGESDDRCGHIGGCGRGVPLRVRADCSGDHVWSGGGHILATDERESGQAGTYSSLMRRADISLVLVTFCAESARLVSVVF